MLSKSLPEAHNIFSKVYRFAKLPDASFRSLLQPTRLPSIHVLAFSRYAAFDHARPYGQGSFRPALSPFILMPSRACGKKKERKEASYPVSGAKYRLAKDYNRRRKKKLRASLTTVKAFGLQSETQEGTKKLQSVPKLSYLRIACKKSLVPRS